MPQASSQRSSSEPPPRRRCFGGSFPHRRSEPKTFSCRTTSTQKIHGAHPRFDMTKVLFACIHNAGRSQMAAALFNLRADPAKAHAISAGTQPGERVHPEV